MRDNEKIIEQIKTRFETMTNKEQTIKRIEFQQEQNEKDQKTYGRTSLFDRLELQYLEGILKDLIVLEILRPHLINAGIGMFDNVVDNEIFHLKLTLNGEEYNRIKEWLENENK